MSAHSHFRAEARLELDLEATLRAESLGEQPQPVRIVDLGLGGAGFLSTLPWVPGTPVRLELVTPYLWDPLRLSGCVCWGAALPEGVHRCGIAFQENSGRSSAALVELLQHDAFDRG